MLQSLKIIIWYKKLSSGTKSNHLAYVFAFIS